MSASGWWVSWPWRLIQTNLRETDMRDLDSEAYAASLKRMHATVAMINTSGIIASYPTTLPFQTQGAFLQGDSLASIIAACHAAGIKVIARTDFSKVRRELHDHNPEWAYRTADGKIVDDAGDVHVCPAGGYQEECAPRIVEETITVLDVDGIYFNMAGFQTRDYRGEYYGICHCAACTDRFHGMFGLALPSAEDLDDPVYRRYLVFQKRVLDASKSRMDRLIHRLRPELAIDRSSISGGFVRQESNTALDRSPSEWPYSASANTKWVVSSLPGTISSNASVDFIDYPVRHVSVSPQRQRLRLAQSLANGGGLDYYVIGHLDERADRSSLEAVRDLFAYHAAHADDYRGGLRSCARIGLFTGKLGNEDEFRGWFQALVEDHFLFDVLLTDTAEGALSRYRALILPDHQPISDEAAQRFDRFVARGGSLIATGRAGFRDAQFEPRTGPALDCLGIERVRQIRPDIRGSYLEIEENAEFPRLAGTDLVFVDGLYVEADYRPAVKRLLRLVPPGPFGPPERCVLPDPTDEPGLLIHPYGAGRTVYAPWSCGTIMYRHGHQNTSWFMADVLQHHAGLEPLGGNLSPMVEVTLSERDGGAVQMLHLVNGSGHLGTSLFEPVTMLDVEVTVPHVGEPTDVTGLVAGHALEFDAADGLLKIHVPKLGLFEAVRIAA